MASPFDREQISDLSTSAIVTHFFKTIFQVALIFLRITSPDISGFVSGILGSLKYHLYRSL